MEFKHHFLFPYNTLGLYVSINTFTEYLNVTSTESVTKRVKELVVLKFRTLLPDNSTCSSAFS